MRRRDFTAGLLLAAATRSVRAQERAKQHRIAIVTPSGPVARISETGTPFWRAILEELRRLGDVEGQNLTIERYSAEGRPARYADLAREVIDRNPEVIVVSTDFMARVASEATATIPLVWIGADPVAAGLGTNFARPGGNMTGVIIYAGSEIWGKRLQILKEAVPSASKIAFLAMRGTWEGADGQALQEASRILEIPVISVPLEESTPAEFQRAFAEIAQERADAVIVTAIGTLVPYRQSIIELIEKHHLPAIYPWRDYVEAGGLMAYEAAPEELGRRMADDVHEILNGAKPGDIPIYQPTKFELVINLKAAKALGLKIPPALFARADEVIE